MPTTSGTARGELCGRNQKHSLWPSVVLRRASLCPISSTRYWDGPIRNAIIRSAPLPRPWPLFAAPPLARPTRTSPATVRRSGVEHLPTTFANSRPTSISPVKVRTAGAYAEWLRATLGLTTLRLAVATRCSDTVATTGSCHGTVSDPLPSYSPHSTRARFCLHNWHYASTRSGDRSRSPPRLFDANGESVHRTRHACTRSYNSSCVSRVADIGDSSMCVGPRLLRLLSALYRDAALATTLRDGGAAPCRLRPPLSPRASHDDAGPHLRPKRSTPITS
jgi:hypothetical protein